MRRAGAEGTGIDTIVASGPNTRPILARATSRAIGTDDLVLLTVAPRYEGYHGAIGRLVLVGEPDRVVRHALDIAVRAQEACAALLRPGIEGRMVEAEGRRIVAEAGLGEAFLYSGLHSVGVIEFEPPIFGPSSPTSSPSATSRSTPPSAVTFPYRFARPCARNAATQSSRRTSSSPQTASSSGRCSTVPGFSSSPSAST